MAGSSKRKTRAEAQAETRARLLEAAARVFARSGYRAASIADIADEAGYSHGAVYSNFDGKEDLFLALYEDRVARRTAEIATAAADSDGSPADRARASAEDWLESFRRSPEAFLLRLEFSVQAQRDPGLQRRLGDRVGAVPLALARAIGAGDRLSDEDAELLALGLQALSLGLALEALGRPDAIDPEVGGRLAALLTEAVLGR